MEFHEFGRKDAPAVLINHGMMQHWKSMYDLLKPLAEHYRLIFTAMDGFYEGSGPFTTFADQAKQIEDFVRSNYGGRLHGAYGASQGALLLTELLTRGKIAIDNTIMDGCYVAHQGWIAGKVTAWIFKRYKNTGRFPALIHISMKLMCTRLEDMAEGMAAALYMQATDESIDRNFIQNYTYHARKEIGQWPSMVHLWCGSKEPYALKSHKELKRYLRYYKETIMDGLGHVDFLLKQTDAACEKIRQTLG
ncbi:MAG: alpha/beta hydrolase [Clostridiales bacterium]|nr:alpha/beta hydrolase [Clostridiales bacterium]